MSHDATPAEMSTALFEPLLGQEFGIDVGDGNEPLQATLIEVASLREAQGAGRLSRQFSLFWRGPAGRVLEQRIYRITHVALPPMELFLVCIGPDAEGMRYEAVFT